MTTIHTSTHIPSGPFDALFCVGAFYPGASDDTTAFEDYLCGALREGVEERRAAASF